MPREPFASRGLLRRGGSARPWIPAAAVLLLLCILSFHNLGRRSIWPPDEGRYGVVVREMIASGDWVLPTYGGEARLDKPPLFIWAGALSSKLLSGEVSEAALRLPSAVSAALMLLATLVLGIYLFDGPTALLGTLVLATSARFVLYSQWVATDMMLAALVSCAIAAAVAGRLASRRSDSRPGSLVAGQLFMIFAGLAVLTKGPVGLVLPAGVVLAHLMLRAIREGRGALPDLLRTARALALGLPAFFAIVLPWFLLLQAREGSQALYYNLFHQNVDRFVNAWNAQQPWTYYFGTLPVDLFPWTAFLLVALLLRGTSSSEPGEQDGWQFLLVWFVLVFAFFSLATGKSPEYLLPLFPAAALMIARSFRLAALRREPSADDLSSGGSTRLRLLSAFAGALALAAVAGLWLIPDAGERALPGTAVVLGLAAGLILAGASGCFVALLYRRPLLAASLLGAALVLLRAGLAGPLMDAGNTLHLAPRVAADLEQVREEGGRIGLGESGRDQLYYYLGDPVEMPGKTGDLIRFLEGGPENRLVLKRAHYEKVENSLSATAEVLRTWGKQDIGYVLVAESPAAAGRLSQPERFGGSE